MPPLSPLPSLTLHLTTPRHTRLSNALLASPHGGPIRSLPLLLESGTRFYELHIPCLLLYDRASEPTLTTAAMTRAEWATLCEFVEEEGVLKVVLGMEGAGVDVDVLGRVTRDGGVVERGGEEMEGERSVGVRFWWREKGREGAAVGTMVRRGLEWVRGVVGG
ncbi:hypothetical protein P171DRAFT_487585 [Karstenula rhodostoma CBS 690.94]|uniref:Uncharacterized protein n=1 Tax=Karstenula rhodostoma CBS 690.94 TaxID=1392251 RepID=A0A9P4PC91_9PLEO|nr:hypothetical protein P171DRAFT_487585 [Karstenula rhodostoma CBS 690.94]